MTKLIWKKKWLILIFAYLVIFLFLLLFDERLNPEIAPFIDLSGDTVPLSENGYFYAVGFNAPPKSDPHASGISFVNAFESALKKEPLLENFDKKRLYKAVPLDFAGNIPSFYTEKGGSCLEFGHNAKDIRKLLEDNQELISRYHTLTGYPHFKEKASSSLAFFSPAFPTIRQTHRLLLANMAMEVHEGRSAEVIDKLANDTWYWRRVLAEGHDLVTKLAASSILQNNYRLLSEIIATRMTIERQYAVIESMLIPLEESELDMSRPKRREFQTEMLKIRKLRKGLLSGKLEQNGETHYIRDLLFGLAVKPNASANIQFKRFKYAVSLNTLSPAQMVKEAEKWRKNKTKRIGCDILYNWGGNIMYVFAGDLLNSEPFYYDNRIIDLDGLIRLVRLQYLAKENRIGEAGMKEFLAKSDSRLFNPYTDKPMGWDAQKQCIYYQSYWCFEADSKKRVELFPFTIHGDAFK